MSMKTFIVKKVYRWRVFNAYIIKKYVVAVTKSFFQAHLLRIIVMWQKLDAVIAAHIVRPGVNPT